jgi:hypothetical protein
MAARVSGFKMAHYSVQLWAVVKTVMKLEGP